MKIAFFFLFPILLTLDIISKMMALKFIPPMNPSDLVYPFGGIGIFSISGISFSLNYIVNTGAAWGFFAGYSGILFVMRAIVILGLISYLLFFQKDSSASSKLPLWLIVTGALGNAIDYALYGHVIDFFHFVFWGYSFPIFNLADSMITLGVFGLLFFSSKTKKQHAI